MAGSLAIQLVGFEPMEACVSQSAADVDTGPYTETECKVRVGHVEIVIVMILLVAGQVHSTGLQLLHTHLRWGVHVCLQQRSTHAAARLHNKS